MVKTNILIIGLAILCYGCKPEIISPNPEAGEVDASHFICIGGNEMAGYLNGALFYDGQQQSLAKLLSKQLKLYWKCTYIYSASFLPFLSNP